MVEPYYLKISYSNVQESFFIFVQNFPDRSITETLFKPEENVDINIQEREGGIKSKKFTAYERKKKRK